MSTRRITAYVEVEVDVDLLRSAAPDWCRRHGL